LAGSLASTNSNSDPQISSTSVERSGPFQQLWPFSYFCKENLFVSGPDQLPQ